MAKKDIHVRDICKELAPAVLAQWQKANPKFIPPVVVKEACLVVKLDFSCIDSLHVHSKAIIGLSEN